MFRDIARALVVPPLGPLLLLIFGIGLSRRSRRFGAFLVWAGAGALILLSIPFVSDGLARTVEVFPPLRGVPANTDAIVVLGGGIRHNGEGRLGAVPRQPALERLAAGAALARRTGLPLVLSGGSVDSGPPEADVLEASLEDQFGIHALLLERKSRTTRENARETAALLLPRGYRRIVLVTSSVHMRRAVGEFNRAGFLVTPAPCGMAGPWRLGFKEWLPKPSALEQSYEAIYEWSGLVAARVLAKF
jgi:uncharacterized SAM-binding protein YcdF (DUF218 family)